MPPGTLIIDDAIRLVISTILADEGYHVAEAVHGQAALTHIQTSTPLPCMIILDLMMPIMNGWDFLQARQRDPQLASIPAVVISATRVLGTSPSLGVQEALDKPLDLNRLLAAVQRYCPSTPPPRVECAADKKGTR